MTIHQFIQVLALVLLVLAAVSSWPRPAPAPWNGWHWALGWAGMALWLLSILLVGWIK